MTISSKIGVARLFTVLLFFLALSSSDAQGWGSGAKRRQIERDVENLEVRRKPPPPPPRQPRSLEQMYRS